MKSPSAAVSSNHYLILLKEIRLVRWINKIGVVLSNRKILMVI
jgi:hypothetical protein